jgi:hypothetical protein
MTGAEAADQAANKAEQAASRPVLHRQEESDWKDDIIVPSTPPANRGRIAGWHDSYIGYKDS